GQTPSDHLQVSTDRELETIAKAL
ncbi:MAG: hypothetical protein JWR81_2936, partial [Pseudonocardia sp.]|nr:hypothetical protein [Pseudonocardia sp.]